MQGFFSVVKIIAICQLIIVGLLVILAYGIKVYSSYRAARYARVNREIEHYLMACIEKKSDFNQTLFRRYQQYTALIIAIIHQLDPVIKTAAWADIRREIVDHIVLPKARVLATSRSWSKRYLACQAFGLGLENQDENTIKMLINDAIPLVAIHAATLATQLHSQTLLDDVIDAFAKNRRVQQALYTQILAHADVTLVPLIKNRLLREKNPYIRAFCYRTLTSLPDVKDEVNTVKDDLNSINIDLKLAALDYLHRHDPHSARDTCLNFLTNSPWEVRAKSAKLLGEMGSPSVATELEKCLHDEEWWVRINAAEALSHLGEEGILILKKQDPKVDRYAYDVAEQVLSKQDG